MPSNFWLLRTHSMCIPHGKNPGASSQNVNQHTCTAQNEGPYSHRSRRLLVIRPTGRGLSRRHIHVFQILFRQKLETESQEVHTIQNFSEVMWVDHYNRCNKTRSDLEGEYQNSKGWWISISQREGENFSISSAQWNEWGQRSWTFNYLCTTRELFRNPDTPP